MSAAVATAVTAVALPRAGYTVSSTPYNQQGVYKRGRNGEER